MRFVIDPKWRWSIANRVPGWSGDTGAMAAGLPEGVLLAASADAQRRVFRIWGYTQQQGDFFREMSFSQIAMENAMPTGRIDVTGQPCVVLHGGMVKLLIPLWGGPAGAGGGLGRVYTDVFLVP